ncbi:MAG: chemotaxis protein CheA [Alphaproteobacteria bacterium]|nr:chemotaxis protein CheA [Alphaproteobacteria bacterium]
MAMDECISEFLVEAAEALAGLDNDIVKLEGEPENAQLIGGIFRTFHTIKGTSGFLGLSHLGSVCHAGENALGKMREGSLHPSPQIISVILKCVDAIKGILTTIEATGDEGTLQHEALIAELNALHERPAAVEMMSADGDSAMLQALFDATPGPDLSDRKRSAAPSEEVRAPLALVQTAPPSESVKPSAAAPIEPSRDSAVVKEGGKEPVPTNHTIRVGIDLLEGLMTTVSELVLSRNQLLQLLRGETESPFAGPLQRLSMITSELQESVMKTRMQPIGNAWQALPRIIRDLGRELGKKIELVMDGAETELDRQVLELIKDPLTHMVRNAADHGLEMPDVRVAAGKSATGWVQLRAFHEGGHIVIQITDDGRGLDPAKIRRKAVDTGLATEAELVGMSDANLFRFILRPGFSTAAAVTAISGRGVGMDVVRTNIERIGGAIDIESQLNHGTVFTIKIPLTLAIVPALIVGCAGERFAIPQISVVELVRASRSGEHRIERICDSTVLRLRDRLLPLIDLRITLGLDSAVADEGERLIIVTQVGSWFFGIVVDRVHDTEEIVVKPVSPLLKSLTAYSGNTILGDGSICMIIDPNGLMSQLGRIETAAGRQPIEAASVDQEQETEASQQLVLVKCGSGLRKAIPLDQIARLEDFEVSNVRRSEDGRLLVPYRGSLMLLVPATPAVDLQESGRQPVLVFTANSGVADNAPAQTRHVGLLVDSIVDIISHTTRIDIVSDHPDVTGATIIDGEPTEIIDPANIIRRDLVGWPTISEVPMTIERIAA